MKRRSQRGYTFIELMLVLAIVSLLTAGAIGSWQHWQQRQRLEESARQAQQFLMRLRAWANWHNSGQAIWLKGDCLGSGEPPAHGCMPAHRFQWQVPHADVTIDRITGEPAFYGLRNTARAGHIELSNASGKRRIIISAFGRIRQCDPQQTACS